MHTFYVICGGFALLGICMLVTRLASGSEAPWIRRAVLAFLPLWFVGAGVNMYVGVAHAGYSVLEELPILVVVFAVPAFAAGVCWRLSTRRSATNKETTSHG